jgi:hypothetical protein
MQVAQHSLRKTIAKTILVLIIFLIFSLVVKSGYAANSVLLTYPNGGEVWGVGDTKRIQWTPSGGTFTSFTIQILKTSGRDPDMIRGKRSDAYGRQTLRVDCCGWESYREAVSYIIRRITE